MIFKSFIKCEVTFQTEVLKNISLATVSQQISGKNSENKKNCHKKFLKNLWFGVACRITHNHSWQIDKTLNRQILEKKLSKSSRTFVEIKS